MVQSISPMRWIQEAAATPSVVQKGASELEEIYPFKSSTCLKGEKTTMFAACEKEGYNASFLFLHSFPDPTKEEMAERLKSPLGHEVQSSKWNLSSPVRDGDDRARYKKSSCQRGWQSAQAATSNHESHLDAKEVLGLDQEVNSPWKTRWENYCSRSSQFSLVTP